MEIMSFDRSGKTSTFRFSDNFDFVAVCKQVGLDLVANAYSGFSLRDEFLSKSGSADIISGFLEMSAHRLRNIFQFNRFVFDKTKLNRIITVFAVRFSSEQQRKDRL